MRGAGASAFALPRAEQKKKKKKISHIDEGGDREGDTSFSASNYETGVNTAYCSQPTHRPCLNVRLGQRPIKLLELKHRDDLFTTVALQDNSLHLGICNE
jgi:hypothetical protein